MPFGKVFSVEINSLPFGEYDECLSIESPKTENKPTIYGQYCSLAIPTNLFPASNQYFDDIEADDSYLNRFIERFNYTDRPDIESIEKGLRTEANGYFIEGVIRYLEYMGLENTRLPPGLCLPSVCDPKHIEYAINKCQTNYYVLILFNNKCFI